EKTHFRPIRSKHTDWRAHFQHQTDITHRPTPISGIRAHVPCTPRKHRPGGPTHRSADLVGRAT
uniref:Uncharacterized protein n=1 Tax=Setaria italica TaxID=4555 RepID=K3XRK4_SETIT